MPLLLLDFLQIRVNILSTRQMVEASKVGGIFCVVPVTLHPQAFSGYVRLNEIRLLASMYSIVDKLKSVNTYQ